MPEYQEYTDKNASEVDGDDIVLVLVDGVTHKMTADELAKRGNIAVVNSQTGTSYTLTIGDLGKTIDMNNASANTLTVPPSSDVDFPINTQIAVWRMGAGSTTILAGSGVTINTANDDLAIASQYTCGVLRKVATDSWVWAGGGTSSSGSGDTTAPTVVSAEAIDFETIEVVFSESVNVTTAGWSFKQNGANLPITSVSGSVATWQFLVSNTMLGSDTLLRSYNSGTGATVDGSSNELASFTDQAVTNSVGGDLTAPVLSTATVETGQPNRVVLTYNESLNAASIPAVGQFVVTVAGVDRATTSVTLPGGAVVNVNFDGAAVTNGQTVLIDYAVPGSSPLEDAAGNNAAAFTNQAVTNNVSAGYDADAVTYFTNQVVTDSGEKDAVDDAVVAAKADSLWTPTKFWHAFLGDTRVLNIKNPLNTDGAFRLTQVVGSAATLNASGATFDGVDDGLNTHFIPAVDAAQYSETYVFHVSALSGSGTRAIMGTRDGTYQTHIYVDASGNIFFDLGQGGDIATGDAFATGIIVMTTRDNGNSTLTRRVTLNNVEIYTNTIAIPAGGVVGTYKIYLGMGNNQNANWLPAPCTIGLAWALNLGASNAQMATLYTIANNLKTGLGR